MTLVRSATFALGADGRIVRITMRAVSPDFSFDHGDLPITPVAVAK